MSKIKSPLHSSTPRNRIDEVWPTMENSDLFKTVREEPMEVDTTVFYREHSEDSSDHTGDSNEHSPAPSEEGLAMKAEITDNITDDLSLDMSKLQLSPSRLELIPPINAQVIVIANQSRLETIQEQDENHTSEARLSEDDEAIQSEHGDEANAEVGAETKESDVKAIQAEANTAVDVENEAEAEINESGVKAIQAETKSAVENETMAELVNEIEVEKNEADIEVEKEAEAIAKKEGAKTEGKEKKKRKKKKSEIESLIDAANNVKF